jgi:hypothetical protein
MPQYSALRCVSGIRQNNAKPLISNGLRFIITCLLTLLWGFYFILHEPHLRRSNAPAERPKPKKDENNEFV